MSRVHVVRGPRYRGVRAVVAMTRAAVITAAERVMGAPVFVDAWHDEHGNWFGEASNAWGAIHVLTTRRRFAYRALWGALTALAEAA